MVLAILTLLSDIYSPLRECEHRWPVPIRSVTDAYPSACSYIGSDKAIADIPVLSGSLATGGLATYYFWRSAYLSQLFSLRNRLLVAADWVQAKVVGRDVSRE